MTSPSELRRSGVVLFSSSESCRRWLTGFFTCFVNGRIWSRIGATVLRRKGRTSRSAGPNVRAVGSSRREAGASASASRSPDSSASRVCASAPGSSRSAERMLASWFANPARAAFEEVTKSPRRVSVAPSSSLIRAKLVTERSIAWRRSLRPPFTLARSRLSGSKRRKTEESSGPLGPIPRPPASSRSWRYSRVSPSSERRISSGLTFGCEFASGTWKPSATGSPSLPVCSSSVMSCRPVRGRKSRVASGWISSAYSFSSCISTTACPSSSSTPETRPTSIPAMLTV